MPHVSVLLRFTLQEVLSTALRSSLLIKQRGCCAPRVKLAAGSNCHSLCCRLTMTGHGARSEAAYVSLGTRGSCLYVESDGPAAKCLNAGPGLEPIYSRRRAEPALAMIFTHEFPGELSTLVQPWHRIPQTTIPMTTHGPFEGRLSLGSAPFAPDSWCSPHMTRTTR